MAHLRLTHLRIVCYHKVYSTRTDPWARPRDARAANADNLNAHETDLQRVAARLFAAVPTLQHVFLTQCGRMWLWVGSFTQLHSKWSMSGAWRNEDARLRSCTELGGAEAEALMDREELQLSQREEVS